LTERIRIGDKWYVAATHAHPEEQPQVLKDGLGFAMFDRFGDIAVPLPGQEGIYHNDTRHLSHLELMIDGQRPLYLGSSVQQAGSLLAIDLMNPDLPREGQVRLAKGTVHIFRAKLLRQGVCHEHIRLTHHGDQPARLQIALAFDADFIDLFEVRGMKRTLRGQRQPPEVGACEVVLPYRGLDALQRRTRLLFDPQPDSLTASRACFGVRLSPGQEQHIYCTVSCECEGMAEPVRQPYHLALRDQVLDRQQARAGTCRIETSNPQVNLWLERSVSDLAMLTTQLPTGPYPFAGVPWYATTFGRDGILTALLALWTDPSMARGVLNFLAATQADAPDPGRDAEPGKILHEARQGEMAHTGEIPFGRYYGTVDATPLFVVLAAAYHRRTGDVQTLHRIWPHVRRALDWIDGPGDPDADGFVEYARRSAEGLVQQGWKDSHDSVFHADGQMAVAPIALCEVQGYVYEARLGAAALAERMGDGELAHRQREKAGALQQKFQSEFWCESLGNYAIALDGAKQQCRVQSSNPGHVLWSGLASPQQARRVVAQLMRPDSFSGWGIRTVAQGQARYNPMSYHNGSVWPHDTALAALGMARYGHTFEAVQVMTALFEASLHFELNRLPELFCGFARRAGAGPTLYPVACSPQAWSAASSFGLLQACLGLTQHAEAGEVTLQRPLLPPFIDWLRIEGLGMPGRSCDLLLKRYNGNVGVEVVRKDADVRVTVVA
jgi:glycogen debranching enzyme